MIKEIIYPYKLKKTRSTLNDLVFKTIIPRNVKLSEAPSFSLPGVLNDQNV